MVTRIITIDRKKKKTGLIYCYGFFILFFLSNCFDLHEYEFEDHGHVLLCVIFYLGYQNFTIIYLKIILSRNICIHVYCGFICFNFIIYFVRQ